VTLVNRYPESFQAFVVAASSCLLAMCRTRVRPPAGGPTRRALQCKAMPDGADDPIGTAIKRMIGQGCPQFSVERKGVPRPIQYMSGVLDRHPGLWNRIADMRSMRGTDLLSPTNRGRRFPDWPDWCYFPREMAAVALVPDRKDDVDHVKVAHELESEVVAALAAWRMTQGIYRFDGTLFCELFKTSIEGEIPVDVFRRLPEWCLYVEIPDDFAAFHDSLRSIYGLFVYRDSDGEEGEGEHEGGEFLFAAGFGVANKPAHV